MRLRGIAGPFQGMIRLSLNGTTRFHTNKGKQIPALEDAMLYLLQISWTDEMRC